MGEDQQLFDFAGWQRAHGLTDMAAAVHLGVSIQTVRNYRKGCRPDQQRAVRVPEQIVLKCMSYGFDEAFE